MTSKGLSKAFITYLNQQLKSNGLSTTDIIETKPVYGGSINDSYAIKTEKETFFIKVNSAATFPTMFEKEEMGLNLLKGSSSLTVPSTYFSGEFSDLSFLLMEHITTSTAAASFWENFGSGLAQLHQNTQEKVGLSYDNYIGSLIQNNNLKEDWSSFFIENRLQYQAKMAYDKGQLDKSLLLDLEKFYVKLNGIFPKEPPALLHGDLWSGNFMVGINGEPVIMDPAVYYGHREMDLAMMHLFGGFDKKLFDAYHEVYPLEKEWENRIEICNLYPLLVHVNLFGGAYVNRVKAVLKRLL